jgi:hypothetical protein
MVGELIGPYKIVSNLGSGGMGDCLSSPRYEPRAICRVEIPAPRRHCRRRGPIQLPENPFLWDCTNRKTMEGKSEEVGIYFWYILSSQGMENV